MASFSLGATPEVLGALAFRVTDQRGIRSIGLHSFGRLSDRRWIVIVVVDRARAMTLGTGDDVAVRIFDPTLATALGTDFHAT